MDLSKVDVTKIDVVKMDSMFWSGQVAMAHYLYFNTAPGLPGRTDTAILEHRKRVDAAFWARQLTLEQMIPLYNSYGKTSSELAAQDKFRDSLFYLCNQPLNDLLMFLKDNNANMDPIVENYVFNRYTGELLKHEQIQLNVEPDVFNPQPSIPDIILHRNHY